MEVGKGQLGHALRACAWDLACDASDGGMHGGWADDADVAAVERPAGELCGARIWRAWCDSGAGGCSSQLRRRDVMEVQSRSCCGAGGCRWRPGPGWCEALASVREFDCYLHKEWDMEIGLDL
ncbi:hypothetical protein Taro_041748 [Colocasia esculenta]|uniref:Uncharacterized protein n=1 Tax=Colocasia esculenta TaxID=4460 RepID=A0A843X153_COLES|nr:hypothetical protein [Colocasia esculenta]